MVRLAFLTSPEPGKYYLNIQINEADAPRQFEIEDFHLANIVADGAHYLLRKSVLSRVPIKPVKESK
jgi:hypothetical protein